MSKKKNRPEDETPRTEPQAAAEESQAAAAEETGANPLEAELEAARRQSDEYLALAQRVQADFENFRRRNASVRADSFEDGARAFIQTILPVMDNIERALAVESTDEALKNGVSMVYRQLWEALEKRGVSVIDRQGEKFDPNLENAVLQGTAEEGEPGTVCAVLQKGYRMGDFVLRHAMVKVVAE